MKKTLTIHFRPDVQGVPREVDVDIFYSHIEDQLGVIKNKVREISQFGFSVKGYGQDPNEFTHWPPYTIAQITWVDNERSNT
jgi:hypothetical protein